MTQAKLGGISELFLLYSERKFVENLSIFLIRSDFMKFCVLEIKN